MREQSGYAFFDDHTDVVFIHPYKENHMSAFKRTLATVAAIASLSLVALGTAPAQAASKPLKFGALYPATGALAFLGDPIKAGYMLAINDINAAGGVNGQKVQIKYADEADSSTPQVVKDSANSLLTWGANVILGAASSSDTKNVIDNIVAHKVVQISSSNTNPALTNWADNGYYFRTAPSDLFQGAILGNQIIAKGFRKVAIIYQDSAYGAGMDVPLEKTIKAKGGTVTAAVKFSTGASDFSSVVSQALAGGPDAVAIISYDESLQILPALKTAGFAGGAGLFLVDGNHKDYSVNPFGSYLNGATATEPTGPVNASFQKRVAANWKKATGKKLVDFTYAASSYDAVIVAALAATAAGKTDGTSIRNKLTGITAGKTVVKSFAAGVAALKAKKKIHYWGFSGPIDFDKNGDPAGGTIGIFKYGPTGSNTLSKVIAANG
jgi:branched-chain amino acid transport system substrate-binding protein